MTRPTLYLTVGLPGTGKTTVARRIESERRALRLTKDEWMKALYGDANPERASDVIEGRLVDIALRALELGADVVLDFGLWGRDERTALRSAAAEVGANVVLAYCTCGPDEQWRRLARREREEPHSTWPLTEEDLAGYARVFQEPTAEELDGSEPLDAPADGFVTWEAWRRWRWPSAIA